MNADEFAHLIELDDDVDDVEVLQQWYWRGYEDGRRSGRLGIQLAEAPTPSRDEVQAFGLAAANPPDGSALPQLDDAALSRHLAEAVARNDAGKATPWLAWWTGLLVDERHRRAG